MGLLANAKERRQEGRNVDKAVIVTVRIVGIAVVEVSVHVEVNRHSHLRDLPRAVTRATVIIIATSTAISILTSTLISTLISIRSESENHSGKHGGKPEETVGYRYKSDDL